MQLLCTNAMNSLTCLHYMMLSKFARACCLIAIAMARVMRSCYGAVMAKQTEMLMRYV